MNQSMFNLNDERGINMACGELPQARMEKFGVAALSDTELVAILLGGGRGQGERSLAIAREVISRAGSMAGLAPWTIADYTRCKGIGKGRAKQLAAVAEAGRRMLRGGAENPLLNRADLVAAHFALIAAGLEVEKFWVACLNRKNRLIRTVEVTSGTATAALAHPREVFRAAIRESSAAIICVHNHPSGDPAPSAPDLHVTRQLRDAAKAVDIELLDHVILGRAGGDPLGRGYFSFREGGML
jgi:DNA repair protein RadC